MNAKIATIVMFVSALIAGAASASALPGNHGPMGAELALQLAQGSLAKKDYANAAESFRMASEQGSTVARSWLNWLYDSGYAEPPKSDDIVAGMLLAAAERGAALAQYNLGLVYWEGRGVSRDQVAAAGWLKKAADQGNALAQASLGLMYANGQGVSRDLVQAHQWLAISGSTGYAKASEYQGAISALMTPAQIAEAQRRASVWKPTK